MTHEKDYFNKHKERLYLKVARSISDYMVSRKSIKQFRKNQNSEKYFKPHAMGNIDEDYLHLITFVL
jgi:hypothetical protein